MATINEKMNHFQKILTVAEVSQYLKIPISTLYELTRKGKIRGIKIGRHWRYLENDVLDFLKGKSTCTCGMRLAG